MFALDETISLGNMALVLVLASAIAALWSTAGLSLASSVCSVVLFNVFFVPPKFTFNVRFLHDYFLIITMLGVSVVVSTLMLKLRRAAEQERIHANQAEQLRALSEQLREHQALEAQAQHLRELMATWGYTHTQLQWFDSATTHADRVDMSGQIATQSLVHGVALPIRGKSQRFGVLHVDEVSDMDKLQGDQPHLQALCDLWGLELERYQAIHSAKLANEEAQSQKLRNTLLTAIAHDYRTPLANLIGAASAIHDQGQRLTPERVGALSQTILDEADQLNRMTSNTLQLARLDAAALDIRKDWESVEELMGSVMQSAKRRFVQAQFQMRIAPALPLLHCDAILVVQLLENLIENAVKYSPAPARIELQASQPDDQHVRMCVLDHGPGIPDAWHERVFDAFTRVAQPTTFDAQGDHMARRGVGLGLAVCRAIARVHDAKIWADNRTEGGARVCVEFVVLCQPNLEAPPVREPL
jgi:two-component system sensor histidine kinase KdpD